MMKHVHEPDKGLCCKPQQPKSSRFAPRSFASRAEDSDLPGDEPHHSYPKFSLKDIPLHAPVQQKLAAARGGEEQEADAASSEEWFHEDVGRAEPVQEKPEPNRTGMPDGLKAGIESLSGIDMSDVRVHANSPKPAQLNALAYTHGNEIYLGPGQERHLPHEAWHAVQQKQGRVRATRQMKGVGVNDDAGMERETYRMGARAVRLKPVSKSSLPAFPLPISYDSSARIPSSELALALVPGGVLQFVLSKKLSSVKRIAEALRCSTFERLSGLFIYETTSDKDKSVCIDSYHIHVWENNGYLSGHAKWANGRFLKVNNFTDGLPERGECPEDLFKLFEVVKDICNGDYDDMDPGSGSDSE